MVEIAFAGEARPQTPYKMGTDIPLLIQSDSGTLFSPAGYFNFY